MTEERSGTDAAATSARFAALDRSQAIIEFDLDGFVIAANDNYLDLLGYERDEIVGRHHRMFCRPDFAATEEYRAFWDGLRSGEFASGEFERIARSGRSLWIRATYNPVLGPDGSVDRIIKFALDVTREREAMVAVESRIAAINRSHGVIEFDLTGRILTVNDEFCAMSGYSADELVGRHHRVLCDSDTAASAAYSRLWHRLQQGRFTSGEFRRRHADGHDLWIQATYHPILDADGQLTRIVEFALDITESATLAIEASNRIAAIERADAVIELSPDRTILRVNDNMASLLGVAAGELIGMPHETIVAAEDDQEDLLWRCLDSGQPMSARFARCAGIGDTRWIETTYHPVTDLDGRVLSVVAIGHDVTVAVEFERDVERRAERDWLTGVANREVGFGLVKHVVEMAEQEGVRSLLAYIDLDGFKQINDTYGHRIGDIALCATADRLVAAAGDAATVARLGGDEFIVVAPGSREDAVGWGERLRHAVTGAISTGDFPDVRVSASVGIAVIDARVGSAAVAVRHADIAAYSAKTAGRACTRVYADAVDGFVRRRHQIEDDLRNAVRFGQIEAAYQPVVDMHTGEVLAMEALMRFSRPGTGLVDTATAIQIAEESDLIVEIDRIMMDRAFAQLARWHREHRAGWRVAVNISARHAVRDDMVDGMIDAFECNEVDPSWVVVEVTETAVLLDVQRAAANMEALRQLGVRVALDDFGTGHASLSRLWDFPVDIVKIDGRFSSPDDDREAAVLDLVVRAGDTLGQTIIAEGIEGPEQRKRLMELGIRYGQGYHIDRPASADVITSRWAKDGVPRLIV